MTLLRQVGRVVERAVQDVARGCCPACGRPFVLPLEREQAKKGVVIDVATGSYGVR